jgi:hypothetical protein
MPQRLAQIDDVVISRDRIRPRACVILLLMYLIGCLRCLNYYVVGLSFAFDVALQVVHKS